MDFVWGSHVTELFWGSFIYISGAFLRSRYRIGIFLGVAKFQIFRTSVLIEI